MDGLTMEAVSQAVFACLGAAGNADAHQVAIQFMHQVKTAPTGWQVCAEGFAAYGVYPPEVRFQCLVVIESTVRHRYAELGLEGRTAIRQLLLQWIATIDSRDDEPSIRNKAVQVLARVFVQEFPDSWPTFFDEVLSRITGGSISGGGLDILFRLLKSIDELVVDREMPRTAEELQRNTVIKDAMRMGPNKNLAEFWHFCIVSIDEYPSPVLVQCLETMALYVSWIDLDLIANDEMLPMLFTLCRKSAALRTAACNCLKAIVAKGMDGDAKTMLLISLGLNEFIVEQLGGVQDDDENEYSMALGALTNTIVLQLIGAAQQLFKEGRDASRTLDLLNLFLACAVGVLGNDYDDISGEVLSSIQSYLHFIKGFPEGPARRGNLSAVLQAVISKMRCDDSFNHERHGDDEIEFLEYRGNLKLLFQNIGQMDPELLLEISGACVSRVFAGGVGAGQVISLNDVELALHIVYLLGGSLPSPHFSGKYSQHLADIMMTVTGGTACIQHGALAIALYDVCIRFGSFFKYQPDRLPVVLQIMLGPQGILSASAHVRSRTCYLLLRFAREHVKDLLAPYLGDILEIVQPLVNVGESPLDLDDQLYLAELLGYLTTGSEVPAENQQALLAPMLNSIIQQAATIQTVHFATAATFEEQEQLAGLLRHLMQMATAITKGLSGPEKVQFAGVASEMQRAMEVFVSCLQIPAHKALIRSGVRTFLHRMIVCMGEHILPAIPNVLESMLDIDRCDVEDLLQFVPLINQLIIKFTTKMMPLLDGALTPLTRATLGVLGSDVDETDLCTVAEHKQLRRAYYEFLNVIASHGLAPVFASPTNAPHMREIFGLVTAGALSFDDVKSQKICFGILRELIRKWFRKSDSGGLQGFDEFVMQEVVPRCFLCCTEPTGLDLEDAWANLVISEIAAVLLAICTAAGADFLAMLQSYLSGIAVAPAATQMLLESIGGGDKKRAAKALAQIALQARA